MSEAPRLAAPRRSASTGSSRGAMTSLLTSALGEWPKLEGLEGSLLEWTGERAPRPARPDDETRAVRRLVEAVVAAWRDEGAPDAAHAVAALAEAALARPTCAHEWSGPMRRAQACAPPADALRARLTRAAVYDPTPAVARACELALEGLGRLAWRNELALSAELASIALSGGARGAVLVGAADDGAIFASDDVTLGLVYLAPGVAYPTHARDAGSYQVQRPCRDCPDGEKKQANYPDEGGKQLTLCARHARAAGSYRVTKCQGLTKVLKSYPSPRVLVQDGVPSV